jgi:hypothetical protein
VGRVDEETKSSQLVLALPLRLIVARRRRRVAIVGVIIKVAKGLGLLEVLLLERLLVEFSLQLVLVGGILTLVLALDGAVLVRRVLVLLG